MAHLVLFDGACGFCSSLVRFVLKRDRRALFLFAPLQSQAGRAIIERGGGDPDALGTVVVVQDFRGTHERMLARSRAALFVASELGGALTVLGLLRIVPVTIADRVYDVIARHRHRIAPADRCFVPDPQVRSRFIDM